MNCYQVIGVKEGNVSGGSGGTHVQAETETDWSMPKIKFMLQSVLCYFY